MKYGAMACVVGLAALSVAGCTSIRDAAGLDKQPPDEFAVVTKAPLVIPPDFNLRPPKPGAAPTNQVSPTAAAEAALYSNDDPTSTAPPTPSGPGTYSEAEKSLLAQADATNADHSIRQQLASDEKSMEGSNSSFTDRVLFGGSSDDSGKAVNADAVNAANDAAKSGNTQAATPADASTPAADPTPKPTDTASSSKTKSDSGGGWFSWLGL
ncbi:MAG TPA: DUF3035 domain-containing protein [Rhizomicrobium sp.]|jgi:hypothetical protein|nr:DUF3035 domain-containing protein [Rhizomicrobium sp.]